LYECRVIRPEPVGEWLGDISLVAAAQGSQHRWVAAGKPAQPIEKSTAGASLLAQIIVGKFASYLMIDGATLSIRRVEYDIEREIKALGQSGLPRADWIAKTLLAAAPQMP
jgi:hypothetical protein